MTLLRPTRVWLLVLGVASMWTGCDETPPPEILPADLFEQAVARMQDGDLPSAARLFEDAESRFAAAGRKEFQLQALSYASQIARDRGQFRSVLEKTARGTGLARQLGDFRAEAALRMIEGQVTALAGFPQNAWRSFDEASRLADTFNEQAALAEAENAKGDLLKHAGVFTDAADHFTRALASAQASGRDDLIASALMGMAEVFRASDKFGEAVNTAAQAVAAIDRTDRTEEAARLRMRLGLLQEAALNPNAAITTYREGVNTLRRARAGRRSEVQLLHRIGNLYAANRRISESRKYYNDALEIARREGDAIAATYLRFLILRGDIGVMSEEQRARSQHAIERSYLQLADRFRSIGQSPGEAAAAGMAGESMLARGERNGARSALLRAVRAERLSSYAFLDQQLHEPYVATFAPEGRQPKWAALLAAEYFRADRVEEGLTILDQQRQSVAADALEEAELLLRHPTASVPARALRSEWRDLRITAAEVGASAAVGLPEGTTAKGVEQLTARMNELQRRARSVAASFPNYGSVVRSDTLSLGQIRQSVPRGITAVEYIVAGNELLTVTMARDGARVFRTPLDAAGLGSRIEEYLRLMQDPLVYTGGGGESSVAPMTRFAILSTELYDLLIRPMESQLDRGVVFISSDVIGRLPMHALEKQDRDGRVGYLIQYMSVDYLSSWSALHYPTKPALRMQNIVAVGNPDGKNWSVDYELRDIRSFYRLADIAIRQDATWEGLRSKRPDLLQLSTSFGPGLQAYGTVALADTARRDATLRLPFIRLAEILPPPVVMLSNDRGDVDGLGPFQALVLRINGTSDVFLNRWTADRKASKFFSEYFFTHLSNGLAPGDAFRQALLNLITTRDVNHPRSWGQFFHFGVG